MVITNRRAHMPAQGGRAFRTRSVLSILAATRRNAHAERTLRLRLALRDRARPDGRYWHSALPA